MMPQQNPLPRWRGFNLLEMFMEKRGIEPFREADFDWMAEWGFDFVRLPMTYMAWASEDDRFAMDESRLAWIDQAIQFGRDRRIHVNLNFHRAPGHCVNRERIEPFNLWKDDQAVRCCTHHWVELAKRYKHIPSSELSFNLWNEPENPEPEKMTRADHDRVARAVVAAIREIDPERLILLDGLSWGTEPLPDMVDLAAQNVHQSCRGYYPVEISHYRADWNDPGIYPEPCWPLRHESIPPELAEFYEHNPISTAATGCDRSDIEEFYEYFVDMLRQGCGVHCGEMGAYSRTPHEVVMGWMKDVLETLRQNNIGFALWNFRGPFGVLDSERDDVDYEDFHGHKLDRQMLELLQRQQ